MRAEQLKPTGNYVLVQEDQGETRTGGGLHLPQATQSRALQVGGRKHRIGRILAMGGGIGGGSGVFIQREAGTQKEPTHNAITRKVLIRPQDIGVEVGARVVWVDGFGAEIATVEPRCRMILAGAIVAEIVGDPGDTSAGIEPPAPAVFSAPDPREGAWDERPERDR